MIEVYPHLFVGNQQDAEAALLEQPALAIVHACKDPYHRAFVGYTGRGAPKDSPEYLLARRGHRLALNIVDAATADYFALEMMMGALAFIDEMHDCQDPARQVLIHCNRGESRGPALALLWLHTRTLALGGHSFEKAEELLRARYPAYAPGAGIRAHLQKNWSWYTVKSPYYGWALTCQDLGELGIIDRQDCCLSCHAEAETDSNYLSEKSLPNGRSVQVCHTVTHHVLSQGWDRVATWRPTRLSTQGQQETDV